MDIKVPEVGESIFEATIAKWHKKEGETVAKDDLLCELETDKITLELNAEVGGELSIQVAEGETVKIGTVIGSIREAEGAAEEKAEAQEPAAEKKSAKEEKAKAEAKEKPAAKPEKPKPAAAAPAKQEKAKPAAEAKKSAPPAEPPRAAPQPTRVTDERVTRKPMSSLRKRIAERLVAVRQQTAMLTTFNEADLSRVMALRKKHKESFQQRHGVSLGFMSFFVKACVEALKDFPEVNARIEGDDIVYHNFYNIAIAVGSEKGLVVPVLKDADRMQFAEIEKAILGFVDKINSNKLDLADLEGGTFTITNGGVYGSLLSTPMLNPPQSGILGMHAIKERPVAIDGKVEIRPMMYLALSYDHRIIDGKEAVNFLKRIKELIEEPEEMLLEL
ncbi:hypothetical protein DESUT3_35250 [Desulfuromonas versatilis]|uniref:Dihydrolipoyllysine-residue succinyltransferase n=1 Tax=Desulfuromonas versatilis TaxID=2802975 RepID=A0ABM8HZD0_9BACT|nr:2-oxoglutarate dehydrogenase complex dihydrolipoyllysine-residue succinyltransferase [Desulfuromonas versatilis]BCR06456.1 hypothetical protein DESUT3_35250 [Desulfuromonas versatilis]